MNVLRLCLSFTFSFQGGYVIITNANITWKNIAEREHYFTSGQLIKNIYSILRYMDTQLCIFLNKNRLYLKIKCYLDAKCPSVEKRSPRRNTVIRRIRVLDGPFVRSPSSELRRSRLVLQVHPSKSRKLCTRNRPWRTSRVHTVIQNNSYTFFFLFNSHQFYWLSIYCGNICR